MTKLIDSALKIISFSGWLFLSVLAGIVIMYYHLPSAKILEEAFKGAELWYKVKAQSLTEKKNNTSLPINMQHFENATINSKIRWDKEKAYDGYILLTLRSSTSSWLIDMQGNIMHHWDVPFTKAWPSPTHIRGMNKATIHVQQTYLFPDGQLLAQYSGDNSTPYGYGLAKIDKDSNVVWTYTANVHHDIYVENKEGTIYTLTQAFVKFPPPGLENLSYPILNDYITILSPAGKEIDKISILDAFVGTPFELLLYNGKQRSEMKWDPLHTNSVMKLEPEIAKKFPLFKTGDILISLRNMSTLAVIRPETRKVVWAHSGLWKAQHSAHFLDNGNILLLDNRGHNIKKQAYSRVVEFNPSTLQTKWYFSGDANNHFFTYAYGRTQRLPNGNTLITETLNARIIEVNSNNEIVWSYKLPKENSNGKKNYKPFYSIVSASKYDKNILQFITK